MDELTLFQLTAVLVLGVGAQWLSWRLRLPSILLLLACGFAAGPVTGLLDPDRLLGPALLPGVSLAVAVILFEGGLSLDLGALPSAARAVRNLITIGALVTWAGASIGAALILGLDVGLALLFGAVLIVTGPTVIIPMLRQIRPFGETGSILRWEGIVTDPLGAMVAVLAFDVLVSRTESAWWVGAGVVATTLILGSLLGLAAAGVLVQVMRRRWVPDHLENPVALMLMAATFATSNHFQGESGLLAVTVMGIALATQKTVSIQHIVEFKENLQVLLLSVLFILLAARIDAGVVDRIAIVPGLLFLGLLILVVRPLAVAVSTAGTDLTWRERAFLACVAPRGIVAAAVVTVFAVELSRRGFPGADDLVPYTFLVIVGTISVYGLTAPLAARKLGLSVADPQGLLVAGAQDWVRQLCTVVRDEGFEVLAVDSNPLKVAAARRAGLRASKGNILSNETLEELEVDGLGRFLALTPNDQVNSLAALHCRDIFFRSGSYQLTPDPAPDGSAFPDHLGGRYLFHEELTARRIQGLVAGGARFKAIDAGEEKATLHPGQYLLFVIDPVKQQLIPATTDEPTPPTANMRVLILDGRGI